MTIEDKDIKPLISQANLNKVCENSSIYETEQEVIRLVRKLDEYSDAVSINNQRGISNLPVDYAREEKLYAEYEQAMLRSKIGGGQMEDEDLITFKVALAMAKRTFVAAGVIHYDYIETLCKSSAATIYSQLRDSFPCKELRAGTLKLTTQINHGSGSRD